MVCDHANLFVKDNDLLTDICQFNVQLMNSFISSNQNFVVEIGFEADPFTESTQQLIEEIKEYKVYDCWCANRGTVH